MPGGAELLVAAGYEYQSCAAAGTGGAGGSEVEELFLVHSMLPDGRGKLRYTLSRYVIELFCTRLFPTHSFFLQDSRAAGQRKWCDLSGRKLVPES